LKQTNLLNNAAVERRFKINYNAAVTTKNSDRDKCGSIS